MRRRNFVATGGMLSLALATGGALIAGSSGTAVSKSAALADFRKQVISSAVAGVEPSILESICQPVGEVEEIGEKISYRNVAGNLVTLSWGKSGLIAKIS